MSADTYTSDDIFFTAAMLYVFGEESLHRIEIEQGRARFSLEIPSLDADEYLKEFNAGELAISDLRSLARCYESLVNRLEDMNCAGETEWQAPRSDAWWARARVAVQERQRERQRKIDCGSY